MTISSHENASKSFGKRERTTIFSKYEARLVGANLLKSFFYFNCSVFKLKPSLFNGGFLKMGILSEEIYLASQLNAFLQKRLILYQRTIWYCYVMFQDKDQKSTTRLHKLDLQRPILKAANSSWCIFWWSILSKTFATTFIVSKL